MALGINTNIAGLGAAKQAGQAAWHLASLSPRVLKLAEQGLREQAVALPMQAPKSVLNVPITGSRRFAAQAWPMSRIQAVGKAAGATVNDVVLAMCAAALRTYLLELDALPDAPLVAMTPVSLREEGDDDSGNAVGTILCNLNTHLEGAEERLLAIHESMMSAKTARSSSTTCTGKFSLAYSSAIYPSASFSRISRSISDACRATYCQALTKSDG